jgi:hypothetical protein
MRECTCYTEDRNAGKHPGWLGRALPEAVDQVEQEHGHYS